MMMPTTGWRVNHGARRLTKPNEFDMGRGQLVEFGFAPVISTLTVEIISYNSISNSTHK